MFEDIVAQNGTKLLIAGAAVAVGLICFAVVLWVIRNRRSSPFIRGGRNRQPRLAVMDAAAVDTRRRLVLVRRDDVEHLIMIGGPTDIVIESRIVGQKVDEDQAQPVQEAAAARVPLETQEIRVPAPQPPAAPARPTPAVQPAAVAGRARPSQPADVSSMSKVLYGDDEVPASSVRVAQTPVQAVAEQKPVTNPTSIPVVATPVRTTERAAEQALDLARQRVLATPGQAAQFNTPAVAGTSEPARVSPAQASAVADNPTVVSEFERMLEAEMASGTRTGATPQLPAADRPEAVTFANPQAAPKSREETEAEMARLLGEISANRKA
ncbi:flagellar biosynthetic protein FliO [Sinorhizobium sp. BG8]|uniref:flagellar biosynthetic protein FliO n=1 Tax=Sinorhizobium sp. BG8 TaxID=2613773 RepID=UPI00193D0051|nr:flagellar biosynthetic protein FliO [Sinorhizobium sp. BG8]QRM55657.1 histidine kinase [Sinorhizobium sp. BG8]